MVFQSSRFQSNSIPRKEKHFAIQYFPFRLKRYCCNRDYAWIDWVLKSQLNGKCVSVLWNWGKLSPKYPFTILRFFWQFYNAKISSHSINVALTLYFTKYLRKVFFHSRWFFFRGFLFISIQSHPLRMNLFLCFLNEFRFQFQFSTLTEYFVESHPQHSMESTRPITNCSMY